MRKSIVNRKLTAGTFALIALASGSAFSQQNSPLAGTYIGIGAGTSHANRGCGAADAAAGPLDCDRNDGAVKIYGGYTLPGTDFAGELSYFDLGHFKASSDSGRADAKGSYWGIGGAYRPSFGNGWGGVARVGAAYGTGKVDYSLADIDGSRSRNDWHAYYGLGVNYAITKDVKLEADWDNTRLTTQVPTYASSTATVNTYTVGASFAF